MGGIICCVKEYCCTGHIVGCMGTQKGGVTSNAVTQSESHVPWSPCPTQPQIPWRLQPLDRPPLCRQTAASTFRLLSLSENFISFSTCGPAMARHQHNHASERKQEYISELSRVGLLIYKVFSEAII